MARLGSFSETNGRPRNSEGNIHLVCPPLPHTLFEAMRLMDNPNLATQDRVVAMANKDPLVAVRLLKIVNSAYYGFASEVKDVDRAVRLLGPGSVAGIILGMNMVRLQATMEGPAGALYTRLIRHSLASAYLAEWLESELDPDNTNPLAFSFGLLSDFGRIALVFNYPETAVELFDEPESRTEDEWSAAERSAFGCNQRAAARILVEDLALPKRLVAFLKDREDQSTTAVIAEAADAAARAFGFWFHDPIDWSDCADLDVWDRLVAAFPYAAGERDELLERVEARRSEVERHVYQLLRRRTDRGPVPTARSRRPPDRERRAS
ncbi:MAG: HDOD domain-containing protein [Rhodothermales bacterium]|nr:HDOD domain-containing protein [Rhodothermales bacterium]